MKLRAVIACVVCVFAVTACSETIEGSPRPAGATATEPGPQSSDAAFTTVEDLLTAIVDQQRRDGTVHFELSGSGLPVSGSGDSRITDDTTESRVRIELAQLGGEIEAILTGGEFFLKLPAGFPLADSDKTWVRIGEDTGGPFGALLGPILEQLGSATDPTAQLRNLGDGVQLTGSRADKRGSDDVTIYDLTIDTASLEGGSPSLPEGIELPGQSTMALAVDGDNRLRDVTATVDLQGAPLVVTTTFSRWGEPVEIEPPPADQVGELGGF